MPSFISRALQWALLGVAFVIQAACIIIISRYSAIHSNKGLERIRAWFDAHLASRDAVIAGWLRAEIFVMYEHRELHLHFPHLFRDSIQIPIPEIFIDPSATVYMNALALYCATIILCYDKCVNRQHQDYILTGVTGFAVVVGAYLMWTADDLQLLKGVVPLSLTIALIIAMICSSMSWGVAPANLK
ncbi:hypothetical protein B0O99DRAFT_380472 [Bisporella sp. PMI_857]|nr:hypothetical protein B0O99DRAFT_380472 [Bisporella sp. PMI_857]